MLGVDRAALPVCLPQIRIVHTCGVELGTDHDDTTFRAVPMRAPVIRSAASRPDTMAVGMPTPGTVDEPARTDVVETAHGVGRTERTGLAERVREGERGACDHPLACPVLRGDGVQYLGILAKVAAAAR